MPLKDENLINVFIGNQESQKLAERHVELALVQAACILALEGINRATATQVADKTIETYQVDITPAFTGQVFASLNIPTATSHGKSRFILEYENLEKFNPRKIIQNLLED